MHPASNRSRDHHGSTPNISTQAAESGMSRALHLCRKPDCPEGVDPDVFRAFTRTGKVAGSAMDIAGIAVWAIKNSEEAALQALLDGGEKHLDLACRDLNAGDARILAHALEANTTLCSLRLGMNRLGSEGATLIAAALAEHPALLELDLGSNRIAPDGFEAIAALLEKNSCLLALNLESNEAGCEGTGLIAQALLKNNVLTSLNLVGNCIGSDGAEYIAIMLAANTALAVLSLGANEIEPEGGMFIAAMLEKNTTLKRLHAGFNAIGPVSANAIFAAASVNGSLESLDLAGNELDHGCGAAIGALLQRNRTLTSLDLRANRMGVNDDATRMAFTEAVVSGLDGNTVLTTLHLGFNHLDGYLNHATPATLRGRIPDLLNRNRTLEALSKKDAYACSQMLPGVPTPLDVGGVMAAAMIMAAPDTAAHARMMVEVHCAVNLLAPQAEPQ